MNGVASLGELLRHARESRGLTLERIAHETRIPQRHLEALEHVDLAASSAGFYQRAEIRAYAKAVGIDPEVLRVALLSLDRPSSSHATGRGDSHATGRGEGTTRGRTYGLIAVGVVVAVVAIGRAVSQPAPSTGTGSDAMSPAGPVEPARDALPDSAVSDGNSSGSLAQPVETTDIQGATERPEAKAPASAVTELVVTTQPAGARVTVNGIGWGVTPLTIRYIRPGEQRIRVTKEGYTSRERAVRIDEGQRQALDIQLERAP